MKSLKIGLNNLKRNKMNKDEYIIVNKTTFQKRIKELEKQRDEYAFNSIANSNGVLN